MPRVKSLVLALLASSAVLCGCAGADNVDENKVVIESEGWQLVGNLELPEGKGPFPAVLLLHQFNRTRSVYTGLAKELSQRGIASLRIDLRGHGESTNKGRVHRDMLMNTWPDVVAALKYMKSLDEINSDKIGTVSASYSGEAVAHAGREIGYPAANVVLSSSTMTAESIAALKDSEAQWWFVAAKDDPGAARNMEKAADSAKFAELKLFESGGHGTNLFGPYPELVTEIADWLAAKLK